MTLRNLNFILKNKLYLEERSGESVFFSRRRAEPRARCRSEVRRRCSLGRLRAAAHSRSAALRAFFSLVDDMPDPDEKWLSSINFSGQVVADVITFKNTGAHPPYIGTPEQITHYNKTFQNFTVRNGNLFYGNREVVELDDPTAQRDAIQTVYDSPEGLGKGFNALKILIDSIYLGIRRETVIDFLKAQTNYQLAKGTVRIASRGLQVLAPLQTWAIDLIDVSNYSNLQANKNFNFIFSCIDSSVVIVGSFRSSSRRREVCAMRSTQF